MKFLEVNAALFQEGVGRNDLTQFRTRSNDHRSRETKVADNSGFDFLAQRRGGTLASLEDHISTLDVSLHPLKAQPFERLSQVVHLDSLVRANIDSAQHRNIDRHS